MGYAVAAEPIRSREMPSSSKDYMVRVSDYFGSAASSEEVPQGFLVEVLDPNAVILPHFHAVNQFQVVVEGKGSIGKHALAPGSVHYTDGFTPYGPIHTGEGPFAFFTLRTIPDIGNHRMPGSAREMERKAGRAVSVQASIDDRPAAGQRLQRLIQKTTDGLEASCLTVGPDVEVEEPSAGTGGEGSYWIVVGGEASVDGVGLKPKGIVFVHPGDANPRLVAGPKGAAILIVTFPNSTTLES